MKRKSDVLKSVSTNTNKNQKVIKYNQEELASLRRACIEQIYDPNEGQKWYDRCESAMMETSVKTDQIFAALVKILPLATDPKERALLQKMRPFCAEDFVDRYRYVCGMMREYEKQSDKKTSSESYFQSLIEQERARWLLFQSFQTLNHSAQKFKQEGEKLQLQIPVQTYNFFSFLNFLKSEETSQDDSKELETPLDNIEPNSCTEMELYLELAHDIQRLGSLKAVKDQMESYYEELDL